MSKSHIGKIPPARLQSILKNRLGSPAKDVLVGPGAGLDCAIIEIAPGRVMAISEDPIFPAPKLPLSLMGEFTVHIGASDVAVSGIKPSHMTYSLLLPPDSPEEDAETIITSISKAAEDLGIAIVGGHTGWYGVVNLPIVGGVTVWGYADADKWISPGGAKDGDVLIMSKGPGIEAAALLAVVWEEQLKDKISPEHLKSLIARCAEITVVKDALTAFDAVGPKGVHAMHDATEGGVLGGIWEICDACKIPAKVNLDQISVPDDIKALGEALDFDIWRGISEGTLLAAVAPDAVEKVFAAWQTEGIFGFELGKFDSSLTSSQVQLNGREVALEEPGEDPFWDKFFGAL